jgi:hypothetical protein
MKKTFLLSVILAAFSSGALANFTIAPITPVQVDAIKKTLETKPKNKQISIALNQANETIADFMKIESCLSGDRSSQLNKFAAPGSDFTFNSTGMSSMKYHSKDACLTVARIHGFEMRAKNALSFEAVFTADDSGETIKRHYTIQQQDDGSWLFR